MENRMSQKLSQKFVVFWVECRVYSIYLEEAFLKLLGIRSKTKLAGENLQCSVLVFCLKVL